MDQKRVKQLPYFYPRPPRGGRRWDIAGLDQAQIISIHALREEGDRLYKRTLIDTIKFLSTPSARRATIDIVVFVAVLHISIHALREEGDRIMMQHHKPNI